MAAAFGVHIGNTSACLAVQREGRCDVVANDAGDRVTPAIVGWNGSEVLVGISAKQVAARLPNSVIIGCKSGIGKKSDNVLESNKKTGAKTVITDKGDVIYEVEDEEGSVKKVTPQEALKEIYKYMHDIALSHATTDVDEHNTVLTVPLDFDAAQRKAATKAAEAAGFRVVQVISEPAAACLAYNLGQLDPLETFKCLVYRCGGQSVTVTIVQIQSGMVQIIKSLTRSSIGGDRITDLLAGYLADEFNRKYKADPRETKRGRQKLTYNAENVKHILSTLDTANCYIESLYEGIDFNSNVTRARFDNELAKIMPELVSPIQELLDETKLTAKDINKVILCGGTSKIPRLQKTVFALFPNSEYLTNLNTDEVIAIGAANQASLVNDRQDFGDYQEPNSCSIKIPALTHSMVFLIDDKLEENILIPAACPVPVRRSEHLTLTPETQICSAKIFLKSEAGELTKIAELSLKKLNVESKVSLSAHIHRDGSVHLAFTDKTSSDMDQITLQSAS